MTRLSLFLATLMVLAMPAQAAPLSPYAWEKRPLLVFAPSAGTQALADQRTLLAKVRDSALERDMAVLEIVGGEGGPQASLGTAPEGVTNADLRSAYDVPTGAFAIILVGKDGGEKARWTDVVRPDIIFARIDRMPMRQREMQREP